MKKVFIDTNIWLRFILRKNNINQYEECHRFFTKIEEGVFVPYTSSIVLLEINYVLKSFYKVEKNFITQCIRKILESRNLVLIESTNFKNALEINEKTNVKLTDCVIATQVPEKTAVITFDHDFKKIKNIISQTPGEFLS